MPRDNPTVPIADALSNKQVRSGRCSIRLTAIPAKRNRDRYIMQIHRALRMVSYEILRFR